MKSFEFDPVLAELYNAFALPLPDERVQKVYFDNLSSFEIAGVKDAVRRIINTQSRIMRGQNVCKLIRDNYYAWKSDNAVSGSVGGCDECDEPGLIVFWKADSETGIFEQYWVPCGYCRSDMKGAQTKKDLDIKGYIHSGTEHYSKKNLEIMGRNREQRKYLQERTGTNGAGGVQRSAMPLADGVQKIFDKFRSKEIQRSR